MGGLGWRKGIEGRRDEGGRKEMRGNGGWVEKSESNGTGKG